MENLNIEITKTMIEFVKNFILFGEHDVVFDLIFIGSFFEGEGEKGNVLANGRSVLNRFWPFPVVRM